jgi:diguanylate cyclase (GGDEF)-like protein/PAS domain S-box-containing protein
MVLGQPSAPEALVDQVMAVISETFSANVVCLVQAVSDRLFPTGNCGLSENDPAISEGWLIGEAAAVALQTGHALARPVDPVRDVPPSLRTAGVCSAAWVPLATGSTAHELLILFRTSGAPFTPADLQILGSVTERLRISLEAREHAASIERLARAGHLLACQLEPEALLGAAVGLLEELTLSESAWIVTIEEGRTKLHAERGLPAGAAASWDLDVTDLPEWENVRAGGLQVDNVAFHLPDSQGTGPGTGVPSSRLCVPVVRDGEVAALMYASRGKQGPFHKDTAEIAGIFASYVGASLANADLYRALAQSEASLRLITDSISDLVAVIDGNGAYVYASPSHSREIGWEPQELLGRTAVDITHPADRARVDKALGKMRSVPVASAEYRVRTGRGQWVWVESYFRPAPAGPERIVLSSRVVDERKRLENELRHQATHDPLTGLANRDLLTASLASALRARVGSCVGLLFCDVDKFKAVNDRLGHEAGDQLLVQITDRLQKCVRPGELLARFGGDEFVVLLDGINSLADVEKVGQRMLEAFEEPFVLAGEPAVASASIGGVLGHRLHTTSSAMLRDADAAMYTAKEAGRARVQVFDEEAAYRSLDRLLVRSELSRALDRAQMEVHYQPIIALDSDRIVAFEALLRWAHPERGPISPAAFIPLAEETGSIIPIGYWVIEQACGQLAAWQRAGVASELSININLSAVQLQDPDLVTRALGAVRDNGLSPGDVCFEVTEGGYMSDQAVPHLDALRRAGVRFALDDFGVSYSSLGYLQRVPVECLKIDRSFVADLSRTQAERSVVRAVLAVGSSLGLDVIAEGIETAEQRSDLSRLGCRFGQGYLMARPLPPAQATALLPGPARPPGRPDDDLAGSRKATARKATARKTAAQTTGSQAGGRSRVHDMAGARQRASTSGKARQGPRLPDAPVTGRHHEDHFCARGHVS